MKTFIGICVVVGIYIIVILISVLSSGNNDVDDLESCIEQQNEYIDALEIRLHEARRAFDSMPYPANYYDFVDTFDEVYNYVEVTEDNPDCSQ